MRLANLLDSLNRAHAAAMRLLATGARRQAYRAALAIRESVARLLGGLDLAESFLTGEY